MRKSLIAAATLALAASGTAFAKQPVKMTDQQMDQVTAGALINAVLVDVVDVNNNDVQVAIPVNAAVAVGILGAAGAAAVQQPGRQVINN